MLLFHLSHPTTPPPLTIPLPTTPVQETAMLMEMESAPVDMTPKASSFGPEVMPTPLVAPAPTDFASMLQALQASNTLQMLALMENLNATMSAQFDLMLAPVLSRLEKLEDGAATDQSHLLLPSTGFTVIFLASQT